MRVLVIYHGGGCVDGFTAAWAFARHGAREGDEVRYHPETYRPTLQLPDLDGVDEVFLLDFTYPRSLMEQLFARHPDASVFDHHASAERALAGLGRPDRVVFDQTRSGAGITWDWGAGGRRRPALVDYVEDRDLWCFELWESRSVNTYLQAQEKTFERWDQLAFMAIDDMAKSGKAITEYVGSYLTEVLTEMTRLRWITPPGGITDGPWRVPVANVPMRACSEVGHALLENHPDAPFSLTWRQMADGSYVYSLRSRPDGPDVSVIAGLWGGGGHPHAAGFTTTELLVALR